MAVQGHRKLLRLLPPTQTTLSSFRRFISGDGGDGARGGASFETADEFERRLFGSADGGNGSGADSFYRKLDRMERAHGRYNRMGGDGGGGGGGGVGGFEGFDTLSDGMDGRLRRAATEFGDDDGEPYEEDYAFRPDVTFTSPSTYNPEDLDLTKPAIQKSSPPVKFETTTKEVLKKADFRNVRFLSNFLTEAGIIIKRSHTKISAKAQRKVAREIKTARAFGLMPFTCMGTKPFVFGKSMEDNDNDYDYDFDTNDGRNLPEADLAVPSQEPAEEI